MQFTVFQNIRYCLLRISRLTALVFHSELFHLAANRIGGEGWGEVVARFLISAFCFPNFSFEFAPFCGQKTRVAAEVTRLKLESLQLPYK